MLCQYIFRQKKKPRKNFEKQKIDKNTIYRAMYRIFRKEKSLFRDEPEIRILKNNKEKATFAIFLPHFATFFCHFLYIYDLTCHKPSGEWGSRTPDLLTASQTL